MSKKTGFIRFLKIVWEHREELIAIVKALRAKREAGKKPQ